MEKFAKSGDFYPNEACPDYGKLQDGQTKRKVRVLPQESYRRIVQGIF